MSTCRTAYIELRRISSIWHFLSVDATKTLMCSLVLSKHDYCNFLLSGSPQYLIQLFQKVQNTAALITLKAPRVEHTSPLLHWLPVQQNQIQSLLYLLCFTDQHKSIVIVRTCQCVHSIQMPALIVKQSHCYNSLCKNQDLWTAFLAYQGPASWNDLPFDLRHKDSLSTFKRV